MRFLKLPEVLSRIPISRSQLYRMVAAGQFPKPHDLGARSVVWLESDLDSWIAERVSITRNAEVSRG
jgi:prophage regulatory protein